VYGEARPWYTMSLRRLIFVTGNKHKFEEASVALKPLGITLEPVDVEKIEIQSDSLEDIAVHAAISAYKKLQRPLVVEDAGLFIESLNGFPGPFSSYVYKTIGIRGVLKLLDGVENRRAVFVSVVALILSEERIHSFRGEVRGYISHEPRGDKGFGFDPIFVPEGYDRTFGELDIVTKTSISHRGKAFRKLGEWILSNQISL